VTFITECLSPFHLLTTAGIAGAWMLTLLTLVLAGWRQLRRASRLRELFPGRVPPSLALLIGGVAGIVSVTGAIAIISPPNTWDAMTYHMSRVAHWIQNQSVEHYPTHTETQLHRSPWAEFTILHLQILSQGDRFANLVQWLSMVGSLVAVTVLVMQLGADLRGQVCAAVVAATLPNGILEASSTQTDYAGTFWLLCFVSYVLTLIGESHGSPPWSLALKVGASLGLALLTKPTNYLYAVPFLTWLVLAIRKAAGKRWGAVLLFVTTIMLAVNLGHYWRNVTLYGTPTGPTGDELCPDCGVTNEAWTFPLVLSNVVRNIALHLGTPLEPLNLALEDAIEHIHSWMGISTQDERITWLGYLFKVQPPRYSEDSDGNMLHLFLIAASVVHLFFWRRQSPVPVLLRTYALAIAAGFFLLCLAVKWNPFNSRSHLQLFVLWSPVVALMLTRFQPRVVTNVFVTTLLVCALPWLLFNDVRPLITVQIPSPEHAPYMVSSVTSVSILEAPRSSLYFYANHRLEAGFRRAVHLLEEQGCYRIGLFKGWDDWEYPLWPLLQTETTRRIRIEHVGVRGPSGELAEREPFASFSPCAYLKIDALDIEVVFLPNAPAIQSQAKPE
jgi:hypothetical protein